MGSGACSRRFILRAKRLTMRAVSANLGAREHDFESQMLFHLLPHFLKRLAEIFLNLAAAQANDVRVFLLEARFVIMLIARMMHQIELIDQAAFFKQFERPVDRDAIEFRIFFLGELIKTLGIEMKAGVIDQIEQDPALASQPDATLAKRILNSGGRHS